MPRRILVIGGLAAGPSAAAKAARIGEDAEVILFEQGEHVSYGICEIPYYVSGEFPEEKLVTYTPATLREQKGVDVRTLHRVEAINPARRIVAVRNLRSGSVTEERYDRLIIATGSRPKRLGVDGEDARNVFTIRQLEDAWRLKKFLAEEKPANAVIIGGGYIGMEMAESLRTVGLDVTLLHSHSLPMSILERPTRERIRSEIERNGVLFVAHAEIQGFVTGKEDRVTHVVTSTGSYASDLVIIAIGVEPHSGLARDTGIRIGASNGILTDQRQQTNLDNIYAAGDCCEVRNIVNNRSVYIPLATVASKTGWVAGENAAGGSALFRGAIRAISVKVFDLEVAHVGLSAEEARDSGFDVVTGSITSWAKVAGMAGSTKVEVTLLADRESKRLLGSNICGPQGAVLRANTLAVAIQHKLTVDDMQQWDLAYSPPFTPLWDPLLVAANVMRKKLLS